MLKRLIKIVLIVAVALAVIAQFIRPDLSNPPIVAQQTLEASTAVPAEVGSILQRSCNDCHTNATTYPWYSRITPVSWWLKDHIDHGREELNFSVWNTYETKRKVRKLEELCEQVETREMPLPSYTWAHRDAPLSDEEIRTLCDWSKAEQNRLEPSSE
jgi:hypothetical protein